MSDTFNLDGLIVDIAACDDLALLDYYKDLASYLRHIAEVREAALQMAGYGVSIGGKFMRRFETLEAAHEYSINKIIAIHECDENEIEWDGFTDKFGRVRRYWIGEKAYIKSMYQSELAEIATVDENNEQIYVFNVGNKAPKMPIDVNYKSTDDNQHEISSLLQALDNQKANTKALASRLQHGYDALRSLLEFESDGTLRFALQRFVEEHQHWQNPEVED